MRRVSVVLMALSAVLVIITGIGESFPPHNGSAGHHLAAAVLFLAAVCIHGWYNRKAILNNFSGLGWRWAVIAGCLVLALIAGAALDRM